MKLGGTTDIKFVRPKQTRHLFCLGRFLYSKDLLFRVWNMTSPFAAVSSSRAFSSLYAICTDNNFVVGVLRRIYRFSNILLRRQQFHNRMLWKGLTEPWMAKSVRLHCLKLHICKMFRKSYIRSISKAQNYYQYK